MIKNNKKSSTLERGHLFIFEGPNGIGKTTLASAFASHLNSSNISCEYFSFPGNIPNTLGKHIYEIHKNPGFAGIESINPTSLQLLHIAAHIDMIESRILPILKSGRSVVLDRYWWSTWTYGVALGCNLLSIENMIKIEQTHWANISPTWYFFCAENLRLTKNARPFGKS